MVFKPLSHLARRSSKAFAHHAQSITAASSTTTSQHLDKYSHHRYVKPGSLQARDAFHTASGLQQTPSRQSLSSPGVEHGNDGLDAYFAAWQRVQHGDEWQQFQFRKRIGWKSSGPEVDALRLEDVEEILAEEAALSQVDGSGRHHEADAVANIRKSQDQAVEAAEADESVGLDKTPDQETSKADQTTFSQGFSEGQSATVEHSDKTPDLCTSHPEEVLSESSRSGATDETAVSSPLSTGSSPLVDNIVDLSQRGHHADVPAAFESILRAGIAPPAAAYNALISAAIHIPTHSYQVIPKVLDVYSDMLRRKVMPDLTTYTLLLQSLSVRAVEVKQSQEALRLSKTRFGGFKAKDQHMFRHHDTEAEIFAEDDSFTIAIKLFDMATKDGSKVVFSSGTYRVLLEACAAYGDVESMIRIHSHMETNKVVPYGSIYPVMIEAFAATGEIRNAIECYEAYKSMAILDDAGTLSMFGRVDDQVYAAVVRGYLNCGKLDKANEFFSKIKDISSLDPTHQNRLASAYNAVLEEAFIGKSLQHKDFDGAMVFVDQITAASSMDRILNQICSTAADNGFTSVATAAFEKIPGASVLASTTFALLAMHVRRGEVGEARKIWSTSIANLTPSRELLEPTTMFAIALIGSGSVDEGLVEARQTFRAVRSSDSVLHGQSEVSENIDEAITLMATFMKDAAIVPTAQATMNLMWTMMDNGGLIPLVAEQLLAGLGPHEVSTLSIQDLKLALQVESGMIASSSAQLDVAHNARFAHILDTVLVTQMPLDKRTSELVLAALKKSTLHRPDLLARFNARIGVPGIPNNAHGTVTQNPHLVSTPAFADNSDPHASTLDQRGSSIIVEDLEKQGSSASTGLTEALARFRNIRRSGRHPRYIAYAKLITAAAKDGRTGLIHDLFGMAEQDVPLLVQYPIVRHGWASILDAMVGACLSMGDRQSAATYHQRLRDIGCAPTANTFGLYITTLKESTKTFDEASEAVKIFHQARAEGVEPSSFLYNALIGKLGKARRIDDCLFYFAEMRSRNIRPTSVTYGTIVNALCRVSDERFAQELFDEMESMPNYKPRPAPYNSLMQFFLTTKRDSSKVLEFYQRMQSRNIRPTMHTYKLLIDTYATLEPVNLAAAEGVLNTIRSTGQQPEAVHYASLIHAKGCVLHDMSGAKQTFDAVLSDATVRPQACLYQALFESMVANHCVQDTESVLRDMARRGIQITPYIANTLIHGWAREQDLAKARTIYDSIGRDRREPSTYEAMTRAFLSAQDRESASEVVHEMLSRGYPSAVSGKVLELLGQHSTQTGLISQSPATGVN